MIVEGRAEMSVGLRPDQSEPTPSARLILMKASIVPVKWEADDGDSLLNAWWDEAVGVGVFGPQGQM